MMTEVVNPGQMMTQAWSAAQLTTEDEDGLMGNAGWQCGLVNLPELTHSLNNSSSENGIFLYILNRILQ